MIKQYYILSVLLISIFISVSFSQNNKSIKNLQNESESQLDSTIFKDIEQAIKKNEVERLTRYFGSQTYFSLTGGINGYYSSNQSFYVLEDFFKMYRVINFKFDNIKNEPSNPYATGIYFYEYRGKRNSAQVYLSLKKIGKNWNISQLTIN